MKVYHVEAYAPFINYNEAYVYLDTQNENLRMGDYTINAHNLIDIAWPVPTDLDTLGYNTLLDEIKPLASKLLKHHTIEYTMNGKRGRLDEDGVDIAEEIADFIAEWVDENENRRMATVRAYISDLETFGYIPYEVSPSKLREIVSVGEDPEMGYALYFQDDVEDYENALMKMIGYDIEDMDIEQASEYLSHIYSTYKSDGFASDFEEILLPFLEEEGYIELIDGEYYLADTEDDEENHVPLEWK